MPKKILARASGRAAVRAGEEVLVRPDFILVYDFPGYSDVLFREVHEEFAIEKLKGPERFAFFLRAGRSAGARSGPQCRRAARSYPARSAPAPGSTIADQASRGEDHAMKSAPGMRQCAMPRYQNVTLRQMRAFVEAYRLRNLTHAAEALHMTQSAMSALIRQFEEELGVQLFERTPRVLRPTKAAEHAFQQIDSILHKVAALGDDMRAHAQQLESVLAFSCAPALSSAVIPTVLAEFKRRHPDVRTVMFDAGDASLIQRVLNEDVEFSIGFFEHEPEAVARQSLIIDYLCAICEKSSALAQKETVTWEDLLGHPIINLSKGVEVQHLVTEALASAGRAYRPAYEISFIHTALALAAQGLGIVVIPGYLVKGNPHVASLVAKKLHGPVIERSLLVHTRQGHSLSEPARRFLGLLTEHLRSLA